MKIRLPHHISASTLGFIYESQCLPHLLSSNVNIWDSDKTFFFPSEQSLVLENQRHFGFRGIFCSISSMNCKLAVKKNPSFYLPSP